MPSPVTTLPLAKSSMVEDAQVGRRRARARWPLRAWGASAVAVVARTKALFSIMLTFSYNGRRGTVFRQESCSGPQCGPVCDARKCCGGARVSAVRLRGLALATCALFAVDSNFSNHHNTRLFSTA